MRLFQKEWSVLEVGVLLLIAVLLSSLAAGCYKANVVGDGSGVTVLEEAALTEKNHKKLVAATPAPTFDTSLERENLVRRLKHMNVQNRIMYVHVIGMNGNVVISSQVQGKVSSLNSLLTTDKQIVRLAGGQTAVLPSPDFDGSYGKNPEGVFWFTPDGEYMETTLYYIVTDRPHKINTPISISTTVDMEKK